MAHIIFMSDYRGNCPRHAFTDGQCISTGCVRCPGKAETEAARFHASARTREVQKGKHRALCLGLYAVLAAIFTISAVAGLSRAERAYQQETRI